MQPRKGAIDHIDPIEFEPHSEEGYGKHQETCCAIGEQCSEYGNNEWSGQIAKEVDTTKGDVEAGERTVRAVGDTGDPVPFDCYLDAYCRHA